MKESAIFLSSDLLHDAHAICEFERVYTQHLKDQDVEFEHHVAFSDGCPAQFKSKIPFSYIEKAEAERGHTLERCFFASHHGKSECDSLGGLVKNTASTHIAAGNVIIQNATDLLQVTQDQLTKTLDCNSDEHTPRVVFLVENIPRPSSKLSLKRVEGTQKCHSVRSSVGGVEVKSVECFCIHCLLGEPCPYAMYTRE